VGKLLRAIDGYAGGFATRCAFKLAPLLFVRAGELVKAEWAEFDLDAAEWRIPGKRMKAGSKHLVPLSAQAVATWTAYGPAAPICNSMARTASLYAGHKKTGLSRFLLLDSLKSLPGEFHALFKNLRLLYGVPRGIRTPVAAVKGRCPGPLDDGD